MVEPEVAVGDHCAGLYELVLGAKDQRGRTPGRGSHLRARRVERHGAGRIRVGEADYVCAGAGNDDPVDGGGGNDHIFGGGGSDSLFGEDGDDTIFGGDGIDEIEPQAGDDVVFGGPQGDELCASAGQDEVRGGSGADAIGRCGGTATGTDRYLGWTGDDVISSVDSPQEASADVVNGGPGTDTCTIDQEDVATSCETVNVV